MSKIRFTPPSLIRASLLVAPALLALAAPATAQKLVWEGMQPSDPVTLEGEWGAGPNTFFINNNDDVEQISFKTPRNLELCDGRPHDTAYGRARGYAMQVTYDGQSQIVAPGSCLNFTAQRVAIRAASPMRQDDILEGRLREVPKQG
jgi:hypothetical protein